MDPLFLKAYFIFEVVKLVCCSIHSNFKVIVSLSLGIVRGAALLVVDCSKTNENNSCPESGSCYQSFLKLGSRSGSVVGS